MNRIYLGRSQITLSLWIFDECSLTIPQIALMPYGQGDGDGDPFGGVCLHIWLAERRGVWGERYCEERRVTNIKISSEVLIVFWWGKYILWICLSIWKKGRRTWTRINLIISQSYSSGDLRSEYFCYPNSSLTQLSINCGRRKERDQIRGP